MSGPTPAARTAQPSQASSPPKAAASAPVASPSASSVPADFPDSPLRAGTYTVAPFLAGGQGVCHTPPQSGCVELEADDAFRVSITVPDGWSGVGNGIWLTGPGNGPPDGAGMLIQRGAWLLTDPCQNGQDADIPVGPTVADFVDAVAAHPILDTTPPVDVTLAGYSGKYFDLQIPAGYLHRLRLQTRVPVLPPVGTRALRPGPEPTLAPVGPRRRWRSRRGPELRLRRDLGGASRRAEGDHRLDQDRILNVWRSVS